MPVGMSARLKSARCRALRHQFEDHAIFQEEHAKGLVWVARLHCAICDTERYDVMQPHTCQLLTRDYWHPEDYDTTMPVDEARRLFFGEMMARSRHPAGKQRLRAVR